MTGAGEPAIEQVDKHNGGKGSGFKAGDGISKTANKLPG